MNKQRSNSKNTAITIITSLGVMVTNLLISFFLSPYIVRTIGVEAKGFVNLANNFVGYANLIVTSLNAMAARFITIEYVKKDYKKANLYYNSVFWGNLIICVALLIPALVFIIKLECFVNVSLDILIDVKILFLIVFAAFFIRTGAPNYDCGTYVSNRMDLSNIPNMATSILRCFLLFGMFAILAPHVWYVGATSTLVVIIQLIFSAHYTHKLTPELKVSLIKPICSFKVIKELVGAGIWSSIAIAGNTFFSGLDLIICNIFLGSTLMGVLALTETLPDVLITLSESIRGAFGPELTINYANANRDNILNCITRSMKITSVIVTIPTAGIVVMGDSFYSLWVPSQDAHLLQILTILAVMSYLLTSGVTVLLNVFPTLNKVRYNAIATIVSGVVSISITMLFIKFTDYDIYAVAGVSSVVKILYNLCFIIPVTSKFLGYKWYKFYPQVGISMICSVLIIVEGLIIKRFIPITSWNSFLLCCVVIGVIGLGFNLMIVLNKSERQFLLDILKRKLKLNRK